MDVILRLREFGHHGIVTALSRHGVFPERHAPYDLLTAVRFMREYGSGSRRVIEQALNSTGLKTKDLTVSIELDSTEGLLRAVEAGLGVMFVSRWAVRNQLSLGTVELARVHGLKLSRRFSMAYPAGPELFGTVGAFRGFLQSRSLDMVPTRSRTGEMKNL